MARPTYHLATGQPYRQLQAVAEAAAELVKMRWWQAWPYGDWHEIEAALRAAGHRRLGGTANRDKPPLDDQNTVAALLRANPSLRTDSRAW